MLTSLVLLALSSKTPWSVNPGPPELKYPGGLTDHQVARMSLKEWLDFAAEDGSNAELGNLAYAYNEAHTHVTDAHLFFVEPSRKALLIRIRNHLYESLSLVMGCLYATTFGGTWMWRPNADGKIVVEKTILDLLDGRTETQSSVTEALEYVRAITFCVNHSDASVKPDLHEFYTSWKERPPLLSENLALLEADTRHLAPDEKAVAFASFVEICQLFSYENVELAPGYVVPRIIRSNIVSSLN